MDRTTWLTAAACAAAAILMASDAARAGPLDPATVGGKAKFVAHVDVERARNTVVGKRILEYIEADAGYAEFERIMVDAAGLMPASDIDGLTIWGEQHARDPKSVLVVRLRMDDRRLRSALALAPAFTSVAYGNYELLSWRDERKKTTVFSSIVDARTILFSGDADTLRRGLDVVAEPAQSLAADPKSVPAPTDANAWAFLGAIDVARTPDAPGNPVLSQLSTALIEVAEGEGERTIARATATALKPEQAPRLLQMALGGKAMAEMAATTTRPAVDGDPPKAFLPELLAATTLASAGPAVTATMTLPNERAVLFVNAVAEHRGVR